MSVSIEYITSDEIPLQVCERWNELARTPLQSTEWMLNWWRAFRSGNAKLSVLLVRSADEIVGIAPLLLRNCWSFGHSLRFLGSGSACTDYQTLLATDGREEEVADAVSNWLTAGAGRALWDVLELEGVCEHDACIRHLLDRLAGQRTIMQTTQLESTWRLDVSQGWDAVLAGLSKSQRAQSRNLINRFDKSDSLKLRIATTSQEIPSALKSCIDLHQLRWKTAGKAGCFADPRFTAFVTTALDDLAAIGRVQITLLEQDGVAVASQLMLLDGSDGIFLYQSGRDPKFDCKRIGQTLTLISIRSACESGAQFIDYLRGDEIYKSRLKARPYGCQRIRVYAPGALQKLRYGAWKLSRELKAKAEFLTRPKASPSPHTAPR